MRPVTVHLHYDPADHWLHAVVGASVFDDDGVFIDSYYTNLAVLDLREATTKQKADAVKAAVDLSATLGVPVMDKDGVPWDPAALDALVKELADA